jgi:hypothetical protein
MEDRHHCPDVSHRARSAESWASPLGRLLLRLIFPDADVNSSWSNCQAVAIN